MPLDPAYVSAVAQDIRKYLGRDYRFRSLKKEEISFLVSMGLLVKDPGDRAAVLRHSINMIPIRLR